MLPGALTEMAKRVFSAIIIYCPLYCSIRNAIPHFMMYYRCEALSFAKLSKIHDVFEWLSKVHKSLISFQSQFLLWSFKNIKRRLKVRYVSPLAPCITVHYFNPVFGLIPTRWANIWATLVSAIRPVFLVILKIHLVYFVFRSTHILPNTFYLPYRI